MPIADRKPIFEDVQPWPEGAPAPAHRGHNNPPLDEIIPAEFRAELLRERPDFLTRFEQMIDAADRVVVTDDETLGKAGDMTKMYRAGANHINATHQAVKEPYLKGGRLVDGERNTLNARLDEAKRKVDAQMNAFVAKREAEAKAERDRIAAEQRAAAERAAAAERERVRAEQEAARAVAEANTQDERDAANARAAQARQDAEEAAAAASIAPAAPARSEPVRSDSGATVSTTTVWECEILDYARAFKFVKGDAHVREAMDKAIKALVKSTKGQFDMSPAVRVWPTQKAIAR